MKKRFVVLLDSSTAEQGKSFQKFIEEKGLGWWHWLGSSWLLVDARGSLTAEKLRDQLKKDFQGVYSLVLELPGDSSNDTWSGYGPKNDNKNMFDWIHKNW